MTIDQLLNELYLLNTESAGQVHDVIVYALGNGDTSVVTQYITGYTRLLHGALPETSEKRGEIGEILQLLEDVDWMSV